VGGRDGLQSIYFQASISAIIRRYPDNFKVDYVDVDMCRRLKWSELDLILWLMEGNFHFIISHVHQGMNQWNAGALKRYLPHLSDHKGWPTAHQLKCPVFTQDKFKYIVACSEIFLPTLRVPVDDCGQQVDHHAEAICTFCGSHDEGRGWVVKYPYVTNSEGRTFCSTLDGVFRALKKGCQKFSGRIPYAMVQQCLSNLKEYKVVLFNGKALHLATIKGQTNKGSAFANYENGNADLHHFAEGAVRLLNQRCRCSITNQLFRVDIMESNDGGTKKWVVNEFENLEATYYPSDDKGGAKQSKIAGHLFEFWERKLNEVLIN